MKLINLTTHEVRIMSKGNILTIPREPQEPARVHETLTKTDAIDIQGTPVAVFEVDAELRGLPDPKPDTVYIVSAWLAKEAALRFGRYEDLVFADDFIKDDEGFTYGAFKLRRFKSPQKGV